MADKLYSAEEYTDLELAGLRWTTDRDEVELKMEPEERTEERADDGTDDEEEAR